MKVTRGWNKALIPVSGILCGEGKRKERKGEGKERRREGKEKLKRRGKKHDLECQVALLSKSKTFAISPSDT